MAQKMKTISPTDCNRIGKILGGMALQDGLSHLHHSPFSVPVTLGDGSTWLKYC